MFRRHERPETAASIRLIEEVLDQAVTRVRVKQDITVSVDDGEAEPGHDDRVDQSAQWNRERSHLEITTALHRRTLREDGFPGSRRERADRLEKRPGLRRFQLPVGEIVARADCDKRSDERSQREFHLLHAGSVDESEGLEEWIRFDNSSREFLVARQIGHGAAFGSRRVAYQHISVGRTDQIAGSAVLHSASRPPSLGV
jgi:hypothetical protein